MEQYPMDRAQVREPVKTAVNSPFVDSFAYPLIKCDTHEEPESANVDLDRGPVRKLVDMVVDFFGYRLVRKPMSARQRD